MAALQQWVLGLLFVHAAWFLFFLFGTVFRSDLFREPKTIEDLTPAAALIEIVITTASGVALIGLATFFVALFPAIYPITALIFIIALCGALWLIGDSPLSPRFWYARYALWRRACSPGATIVYLGTLVLSIRAVIPDTGSDATAYYMVYAYEWAVAHHIYVDPWLRLPYYTNNWILLQMWFIELGGITFVTFLTWLTGALTMLGIYGAVEHHATRASGQNAESRLAIRAVAVLSTACLGFSLTFLIGLTSEMVDIPIGFFFLCTTLAAMRVVDAAPRFLRDVVVCGAFLVGMKVSLLAFFPAFAIVIVATALKSRLAFRPLVVFVALFAALSLPWYVKDFIQAGDPIAPTLNILFRGVDSKMSAEDFRDQLGNLRTDKSPGAMLLLPLRIFSEPSSSNFRELGETALLLLLMLPGILVAWYFIRGTDLLKDPLVLLSALVFYAIAYWTNTSYLARYALLFYPTLAILVGLWALRVTLSRGRAVWVSVLLVLLCATPSISGLPVLQDNIWRDHTLNIWSLYSGREEWINTHNPFNESIQYTASALQRAGKSNRHVYVVQLEIGAFFFRERGITSIGDWFGPERYSDFAHAIRDNHLAPYISRFQISAFIIPQGDYLTPSLHGLTASDIVQFDVEARELGFTRIQLPTWHYAVYLAPGVD